MRVEGSRPRCRWTPVPDEIRKHYKFPGNVFAGGAAEGLRDVLDQNAGSSKTP
jgi:hypothetical protein